MVVDDLQQVMLGIFKDHENTLRLQDDLDQVDQELIRQLGAKCHFSDCRLGDASILQFRAFFVRLEFLNGEGIDRTSRWMSGRFRRPRSTTLRDGLVYPAIRATTDEADDVIVIIDVPLGHVWRSIHLFAWWCRRRFYSRAYM